MLLLLQAALPRAVGSPLGWTAQLLPDVTRAHPPGAGLQEVADLQSEQPRAKGKPAGESSLLKQSQAEWSQQNRLLSSALYCDKNSICIFGVACCVAGAEQLC